MSAVVNLSDYRAAKHALEAAKRECQRLRRDARNVRRNLRDLAQSALDSGSHKRALRNIVLSCDVADAVEAAEDDEPNTVSHHLREAMSQLDGAVESESDGIQRESLRWVRTECEALNAAALGVCSEAGT